MEAPRCRHCRQRRGAAGIACRCRPRTVPAGTTDLRISAAGIPARSGEQRACRTAGAGGVSASTPARAYLLIDALQWLLGSRGRWRSPQPRIPGASRLDWRCDDAGTAPDHARRAIGPHGITATRDGLQAARSALAQACDARSGSASAGAKRKAQPMKAGLYRWWRNTEPNPRPLSEPDSNTLALRAWIRRFGHRHCSESKSNSSQSLPDQRKPSSSGMADAPFGRIEKCRLFPVVLSDQVAWHVPHWQ